MANLLIYKIEFLQDNPFGDFVTGDILDIYIDEGSIVVPASSYYYGISAEKNGISFSPGGVGMISLDPTIVSIQRFGTNICVGTSFIYISQITTFPFAQYDSLANHYSCLVNPPVCDLIVNGPPTTTPASDETTADGSIEITASSTNPIKYRLNEDFAYEDGSGQTSNVFSDLLPGDYRVFLRDSANCGVNVLVNVAHSNVYGVRFRLEYTLPNSLSGFSTRIDISKRNYSGDIIEVKGSDVPFILNLRGEGITIKHEPMLASDAEVTLASETDRAFIELYTNDRNLYRVNYYKNFGSGYVQVWTGKILPFIYAEPVIAPPYYSLFKASDGLPELKDNVFAHKDGQKFFGTASLIKIVAYCLSFLKLGLNIRVAINLYATEMDQGDSDDPLDQAYIDYECFYLATQTPDADFVLRNILKAFKARITQWNNVWNIVRLEEMASTYDYREFDANGNYVSSGFYNPVKNLDYPLANGFMLEKAANLELQQGYGRVIVHYQLGLKSNIIDNGDFRLNSEYVPSLDDYTFTINRQGFTLVNGGYPIIEGYELLADGGVAYYMAGHGNLIDLPEGGNAYLQTSTYFIKMGVSNQLKINIRYKVNYSLRSIPKYYKVRLRIKYGDYYLQSDGSWTASETLVSFIATTFNEFLQSEISAGPPPGAADGLDFEIRIYHAYAYFAQFQSASDLEEFITYSGGEEVVPNGYRTELRDDFTFPSKLYYYELEDSTETPLPINKIIRPEDYDETDNPRQWIYKGSISVNSVSGNGVYAFYIDRIQVGFLTNNEQSIDTVIRSAKAENENLNELEETLIIGSHSSEIVTEKSLNYYPRANNEPRLITISVLSPGLIYTGWLRDSDGNGYEYWKRDEVSESDKLHGIWLKSTAYQYSRSWGLLRGTILSKTGFFSLIDSLMDVNDGDKKYIPISLSINDKANKTSGEFLELITDESGLPGTGTEFGGDFSNEDFGNNFN